MLTAAAVLALGACSGSGGLQLIPIGADNGIPLPSFDPRLLNGKPKDRPGRTDNQIAIDAVGNALDGYNSLGLRLRELEDRLSAASICDSFVFVPVRSPSSRAVTTEIVDEDRGGFHVHGGLQRGGRDQDQQTDLRITGPHTDLRLRVFYTPPDHFVVELTGNDVDATKKPVNVVHANDQRLDDEDQIASGRSRIEVRRGDGTLQYADDLQHGGGSVTGRDIWNAPDGFNVRSTLDLTDYSGNTARGVSQFAGSDGSTLNLVYPPIGGITGEVRAPDGHVIASLMLGKDGNVTLLDTHAGAIHGQDGTTAKFPLRIQPGYSPG